MVDRRTAPARTSAEAKRRLVVVRDTNIQALEQSLLKVVSACRVGDRIANDPVGIVREVGGEPEREIAALLAASLAFGNVKSLRASIRRVLDRLGPSMLSVLDSPRQARRRLEGTGHRMIRDEDIWRLLTGARALQREHGTLGAQFEQLWREHDESLREALTAWVRRVREAGGLTSGGIRRGPAHVLPDPAKNSGCKRLLLFLRWVVRADDGVDLGLWRGIPASALLVPVDVHIHRLGTNLGWTSARAPSWVAAEEITAVLRRIDPADPVRFDFALCHMQMSQRCPSARNEILCAGCGVRSLCRHWVKNGGGRGRPRTGGREDVAG